MLAAGPAFSETLRLATYAPGLSRNGPALLLAALRKGDDPQIAAAVQVIVAARADVLLLTGFDWDQQGLALDAFSAKLAEAGADYPHRLALRPNAGVPSGIDLDGDGRDGTPDDALGFGLFTGQGGMALLSRRPFGAVRDLTGTLWRDVPGNAMPPVPEAAAAVQPLSSTGHWDVELPLPGGTIHLLAYSATPPVFDGPEDRNGRRGGDETAFWTRYDAGGLVVVMGNANIDPVDGEGAHDAIAALIARLHDPQPRSAGGEAAAQGAAQRGDPALDTADWPEADGPGNLRVDYVLPDKRLTVAGSGVLWPAPGEPLAEVVAAASPHRLVWVDLSLP